MLSQHILPCPGWSSAIASPLSLFVFCLRVLMPPRSEPAGTTSTSPRLTSRSQQSSTHRFLPDTIFSKAASALFQNCHATIGSNPASSLSALPDDFIHSHELNSISMPMAPKCTASSGLLCCAGNTERPADLTGPYACFLASLSSQWYLVELLWSYHISKSLIRMSSQTILHATHLPLGPHNMSHRQ